MPKKGTTLPWRLTFQWEGHPKPSTTNYSTPLEAVRARADMIHNAETKGVHVETSLTNRETGQTLPLPHMCTKCGLRRAHPAAVVGPVNKTRTLCKPCGEEEDTIEAATLEAADTEQPPTGPDQTFRKIPDTGDLPKFDRVTAAAVLAVLPADQDDPATEQYYTPAQIAALLAPRFPPFDAPTAAQVKRAINNAASFTTISGAHIDTLRNTPGKHPATATYYTTMTHYRALREASNARSLAASLATRAETRVLARVDALAAAETPTPAAPGEITVTPAEIRALFTPDDYTLNTVVYRTITQIATALMPTRTEVPTGATRSLPLPALKAVITAMDDITAIEGDEVMALRRGWSGFRSDATYYVTTQHAALLRATATTEADDQGDTEKDRHAAAERRAKDRLAALLPAQYAAFLAEELANPND